MTLAELIPLRMPPEVTWRRIDPATAPAPLRRFLTAGPARPADLVADLDRLCGRFELTGRTIAVAVGSRGIHGLPVYVRLVVDALRRAGAEPFCVPAMGSHGASTAEGQAAVLARLGVTPESVGAPLRATMETVVVGHLPDGLPLHVDTLAAAADGLVLVNRIKPHTSFRGRFESGLLKQLAVGLGNQAGAEAIHLPGVPRLGATIEAAGRALLAALPVLGGVAIVEAPDGAPAVLEALPAAELLEREPVLLETARALLPRLPFDQLDVLVVDQLGKDIAGTGMDPNVIGRLGLRDVPEPESPAIRYIVVLDLSPATGGNGLGIGLADLTTRRLVDRLDLAAMRANALTTGLLERIKMPLTCADADEAVALALSLIRDKPAAAVRLARIRNTKDLERLEVSPALLPEALAAGLIEEVV